MKLCYFAAADGIETYQLHEDDTLTLFDRYSAARPMYFSYDSGRLFALLRDPAGNGESAVLPLWVDDAGLPTDPCPSVPTGGREGCHLCVLDNVVYAANYSSGSIARIPLDGSPSTLLTHEGHGIRPDRQEMAHTHFIAPRPGNRYLAVCDLGLDRVFVYDRDLNPISEVRFPDECGPRHLCYSPDGQYAYCANELSSTVSILSCNGENGTFTHLSHLTTRAASHTDNDNYPAAIRCDGSYVYVSNRGDDDVVVFRMDNGGSSLTPIANLSTGGHWPRDIWVDGDLLFCTNERSDNITVFRMTKDRTDAVLIQEIREISQPIAVLVV